MIPIASVIIPTAPAHLQIAEDALRSAYAQTVPVEVIQVIDHNKEGAAKTRNKGAVQAKAPFLVFLDADDLLMPDFVERCLGRYKRGGFVFTDWVEDGEKCGVEPCDLWLPLHIYHYITTLIPTVMFEQLGGFDETLPALEDIDFYLKARFSGWQSWYCPGTLWHYRRAKGISNTNKKTQSQALVAESVETTRLILEKRYAEDTRFMANCCGKTPIPGDDQPGDILVEALYAPQKQRGTKTGRIYPRAGFGDLLKVDPKDAHASPKLWKIVPDTISVSPDVSAVLRLARR